MNTDPLVSASRLRRISACAREGRPIDPSDASALGDAIDAYLAGVAATLDQALGLAAPGRGKADARRALLIEERDEALHRLADLLGTAIGDADSEGIHDLFEALSKFAEWRWPELRAAVACPSSLDPVAALFWTILRGTGGRLLSRRWLADFFRSRANRISA